MLLKEHEAMAVRSQQLPTKPPPTLQKTTRGPNEHDVCVLNNNALNAQKLPKRYPITTAGPIAGSFKHNTQNNTATATAAYTTHLLQRKGKIKHSFCSNMSQFHFGH
jgi:hypothetical protein